MQVFINIKGVSNKQNKIRRIVYDYPSKEVYSVKEFLEETVMICLNNYTSNAENEEVMKALSAEEIDDSAASGKVLFGVHFNKKKPDKEKAKANAIQCFEDGIAAVFVDGIQYEDLDEVIPVKDGSEAVFVKLSMLAGRMW